ncbi:MAG: Lysine decarboxylase [Ilumatobacteraceae bacterium]|nr:Lysine decarboxylase [Ilumatobacteraceae bacterium]
MSTLGSLARAPRLCVYCGSNVGSDPAFRTAAHALGEAMARRGIGLVYGGGQVGLMGIMADAALAGGGEVIGVITDQLVSAEVAHRGLSSLEVVPDMHQRKARFEQLSDGFIALPGGFGTVEEVIEMLTWNQLGLVRKPVVILDVEHYWGAMFDWMDSAVSSGFVRSSHRMLAQRAHTVDEALALALAPAPDTPGKWIDRDTGQIPITPGPVTEA